eukprot:685840-Amorphochlora_amoeboformis.AAC.1
MGLGIEEVCGNLTCMGHESLPTYLFPPFKLLWVTKTTYTTPNTASRTHSDVGEGLLDISHRHVPITCKPRVIPTAVAQANPQSVSNPALIVPQLKMNCKYDSQVVVSGIAGIGQTTCV